MRQLVSIFIKENRYENEEFIIRSSSEKITTFVDESMKEKIAGTIE